MLFRSVSDEELIGREDFRDCDVITIDGVDTKDYDDAISVKKIGENYELAVHIADVSNYVKYNTPIDKEAFKRATSVYCPSMVLPMLPRELSNGICSLNPKVTRLTLSCIMTVNNSGSVIKSLIVKGIIKTKERMNYDNVADILCGDPSTRKEFSCIVPMLDIAKELALILREKRITRGSIEFDLPEAKIILDCISSLSKQQLSYLAFLCRHSL